MPSTTPVTVSPDTLEWKTEIITQVVSVTPELATEYLQHNVCNRAMKPQTVRNLALLMTNGEFGLTHQGIAFNTDGDLVDGQHRCAAIITSGKTVQMMVSFNLPKESFTQIDTGGRRTGSDTLYLVGETDTAFLGRLLRGTHLYDISRHNQWLGEGSQVDNTHMLVLLEKYSEIRDTRELARALAKATGLLDTSCGIGIYLTQRANPGVDLNDWYDGLLTGANLSIGDPRLALRQAMVALKSSGSIKTRRRSTRQHLAYYLRTFNAWANNQSRYQLRATISADLPLPAKVKPRPVAAAA